MMHPMKPETERKIWHQKEQTSFTEPPAVEVVVDEMIAILSDRDQLIKKKEAEQAQAVISEIYRNGL